MAARSAARKDQPPTDVGAREVEAKLVALAEQLGTFLGTVRGKADGWIENESLRSEVTRVRDRATELLEQVNRGTKPAQAAVVSAAASARTVVGRAATSARESIGPKLRQTAATVSASAQRVVSSATASARKAAKRPSKKAAARKAAKAATPKASRGSAVDAPGKKHRTPPPQVHIGRGMGEPGAGRTSRRASRARCGADVSNTKVLECAAGTSALRQTGVVGFTSQISAESSWHPPRSYSSKTISATAYSGPSYQLTSAG